MQIANFREVERQLQCSKLGYAGKCCPPGSSVARQWIQDLVENNFPSWQIVLSSILQLIMTHLLKVTIGPYRHYTFLGDVFIKDLIKSGRCQ